MMMLVHWVYTVLINGADIDTAQLFETNEHLQEAKDVMVLFS